LLVLGAVVVLPMLFLGTGMMGSGPMMGGMWGSGMWGDGTISGWLFVGAIVM
jgi:putative membrane protein